MGTSLQKLAVWSKTILEPKCPRGLDLILLPFFRSAEQTRASLDLSEQACSLLAIVNTQGTHSPAEHRIKTAVLVSFLVLMDAAMTQNSLECVLPLCSEDILYPHLIYPLQFLQGWAQMVHIVLVLWGVWLQGHILGSVKQFSQKLNSHFIVWSVPPLGHFSILAPAKIRFHPFQKNISSGYFTVTDL